MRARIVALTIAAVVIASIVGGVFFLPVVQPTGYGCHGGLACIHYVSLSCAWFEFGSYATYSGHYFLTYHCPAT